MATVAILPRSQPAFETFLAMEKASWKVSRAPRCSPSSHDAVFVRRLLRELAAQGDASVALLRFDGEAIAAQVLMYCGSTAYTWRSASMVRFSKYSPGALLVDRITEELFAGPDIQAINSCAVRQLHGSVVGGALCDGRYAVRYRARQVRWLSDRGRSVARLRTVAEAAQSYPAPPFRSRRKPVLTASP